MLPAPWAHAAALPAGLRPEPPPPRAEQGAARSRPAAPAAQPHSWQPGGRAPAAETAVPTGGARSGEWAAGEGGKPRELTFKGAGLPCPGSCQSHPLPCRRRWDPSIPAHRSLLSPLLSFPLPSVWARLLWWGAQMNAALFYPEETPCRGWQTGRQTDTVHL